MDTLQAELLGMARQREIDKHQKAADYWHARAFFWFAVAVVESGFMVGSVLVMYR